MDFGESWEDIFIDNVKQTLVHVSVGMWEALYWDCPALSLWLLRDPHPPSPWALTRPGPAERAGAAVSAFPANVALEQPRVL